MRESDYNSLQLMEFDTEILKACNAEGSVDCEIMLCDDRIMKSYTGLKRTDNDIMKIDAHEMTLDIEEMTIDNGEKASDIREK